MKNQVLPSISELLYKPIMILNSLANPESIKLKTPTTPPQIYHNRNVKFGAFLERPNPCSLGSIDVSGT
jgi:hypothetical protein